MIRLASADPIPAHPFAAPERSADDLAVMRAMLARLRRHLRETLPATGGPRADTITDADGAVNKLIVPSIDRVRRRQDLVAVGFFGQARPLVDHAPIVELESALIADMPGTPGLVTYFNRFVPGEGWGNLVLFEDAATKDAWGGDPRHDEAVRRSPAHYHSIRLHNAALPGGVPGDGELRLLRTRYLDFAEGAIWRALRTYAG